MNAFIRRWHIQLIKQDGNMTFEFVPKISISYKYAHLLFIKESWNKGIAVSAKS